MRRGSLLAFCFAVLVSCFASVFPATDSAWAQPASLPEMRRACESWLERRLAPEPAGSSGVPDRSAVPLADRAVSAEVPLLASGRLIGCAFLFEPSGFVLVSARRELPPILAYSAESAPDFAAPAGTGAILRGRLELLDGPAEVATVTAGAHRVEWRRLLDAEKKAREILGHAPQLHVGPLLRERYHQGPPYNLLAPTGCGGVRCPAGCTSVAAAQIAHHHASWMNTGLGPQALYWGGDDCCQPPVPGAVLTADLGGPFDFDLMPDSCLGSCGAAADSAVAELVYELGVVLGTDYSTCGSSSNLLAIPLVLEGYFGYEPGSELVNRFAVGSAHDWFVLLREDLDRNCPVPYSFIYTNGGAHDAVCDGWGIEDEAEWFHLNLGQGDAGFWFRIDDTGMSDPMNDYIIRGVVPAGRRAHLQSDGGGDFPTIQAALDAMPPGSVLELEDGIYRGAGNVDLDPRGKGMTIRSAAGDPAACVIDCEGSSSNPHRALRAGAAVDGPPFVLEGLTIRGGFAPADGASRRGDGGAIRVRGPGLLLAENCRFETNRGLRGGAIVGSGGGRLFLDRCVLLKNEADRGGAVRADGPAVLRLEACTFYGNTAKAGSGVDLAGGAAMTARSCIIASGRDGDAIRLSPDEDANLFCCDLWDNDGGDWTPPLLDQLGVEGNISEDPQFCGADAGDLALGTSSPCGDPPCGRMGALGVGCAGDLEVFLVGHDQPYATIAEALAAAAGGGRLVLMDSLFTGEGNRDLLFQSGERTWLVIESAGGEPSACAIDLEGGPAAPHQWLRAEGPIDLTVRGLGVRNAYHEMGGALYGYVRSLDVEDCAFSTCVAPGATGGKGGAICCLHADSLVSLERCEFLGCSATRGGAAYVMAAERCVIDRCRFANNAAGTHGGAVYSSSSSLLVRESIWAENSSALGGAIWVHLYDSGRVENCTFVRNQASSYGSCILLGGALQVANSIFAQHPSRPPIECYYGPLEMTCNDLWQNHPNTWLVACTQGQHVQNLELDPLFCGEEDFHLQDGSPCLPGQPGNDGCGWIGALPAGCGAPGEPEDAASVDSALESSRLRLESIAANPFRDGARLRLSIPSNAGRAPVRLTIFDASGRRVRTLLSETATPGRREVSWDARDDSGRRVPSGIYLGSVRAGVDRAQVRLIVIR